MIPDNPEFPDQQGSRQSLVDEIASLRRQLAEAKRHSSRQQEQHVASAPAQENSDQNFAALFASLPRGIQQEDYSAVKHRIDQLRGEGVEDLEEYLLDHPQLAREMVGSIKVNYINNELARIHRATSVDALLREEADTDGWWSQEWVKYYAAEFAALAGPDMCYEGVSPDVRFDGSQFFLNTVSAIAEGYEQSWGKVISLQEDVTEKLQIQAAMIEARSQAVKANQEKTEFLSSMSHELRAPLNAILGFSQLLELDQDIEQRQRNNAAEINRAGSHLLSLIDQVLDLSRIESGKLELAVDAVPVLDLLTVCLKWVKELAQGRGIEIDFEPENFRGLVVQADAVRLKQVFLNLLTNAIKYNREHGKVSIIPIRRQSGNLRFGIKDTGLGISEERIGDLFQPFQRLGAEHTAIEGNGVGLAIARQLVEAMHGSLEVESVPGEGCTFWVELKQPKESDFVVTKALEPEAPGAGDDSDRPRILVAEDNPVNQELMAAQLELLDYSADFAANGAEALELWKLGNYQLLLTDIRMPVMDGCELIQRVRAMEIPGRAAVPIIALTANAMESDLKRCFEAGADKVVTKPFNLKDLHNALQKGAIASHDQAVPQKQREHVLEAQDEATLAPIDIAVLRESVGLDIESLRQILTTYYDELPAVLHDIQNAFAWRNDQQLAEYTHKLKSSTRSIGAKYLGDLCEKLEQASHATDRDRIQHLVPKLVNQAGRVKFWIEAYFEQFEEVTEIEIPGLIDPDVVEIDMAILIVDDDPVTHNVTTLILKELGVRKVSTAMSGSRALEKVGADPDAIDVIICDLNMPGMDGVEFIRHLAKKSYSGSLILTSGDDLRILKTVEKLAFEHELNVLGVMLKPATYSKLGELLELYDQTVLEGTIFVHEVISADELLRAINGDELEIFFQPKVDVRSKLVVGVEALVRWNHPVKGLLKPHVFIGLAEENNLIYELSQVVCKKAMHQAARLKAKGFDLDIAINVSVDALKDLAWPDEMAAQTEASGLETSNITFEITESRLMGDTAVGLDILSRLSLKRFKLSIDDFGTGYSSMEQLQRIPFSELKIDRAFVKGAVRDASARAIIETSVMLARKLEMKVIAEGVETREEWDLVERFGCDQVQGYYVARPMPAHRFGDWLAQWKMPEA